jgi:hypothetical protein
MELYLRVANVNSWDAKTGGNTAEVF